MLSEVLAQGRPIILDLWARLCPVCRAVMPELQAAHEEHGDRVLVVGVEI
ncbi:MAG: TlpA family protein disulfide reductase [Anaerolineae bacterium]